MALANLLTYFINMNYYKIYRLLHTSKFSEHHIRKQKLDIKRTLLLLLYGSGSFYDATHDSATGKAQTEKTLCGEENRQ
jgi:hypothetical protein